MQARSRERLETILEAAARLFADDGFDATTMDAIAVGAGTSIGSVYRFFSNKLEVFRAVAGRCIEESDRAFVELLGPNPFAVAWYTVLDAVIDGFAERTQSSVMFRAAWRNLHLYDEYAEEDEALMAELSQRTAGLIQLWAPHLDKQRRIRLASNVVQTITSMLYGISRDRVVDPEPAISETKLMLRRYLEPEIGTKP